MFQHHGGGERLTGSRFTGAEDCLTTAALAQCPVRGGAHPVGMGRQIRSVVSEVQRLGVIIMQRNNGGDVWVGWLGKLLLVILSNRETSSRQVSTEACRRGAAKELVAIRENIEQFPAIGSTVVPVRLPLNLCRV